MCQVAPNLPATVLRLFPGDAVVVVADDGEQINHAVGERADAGGVIEGAMQVCGLGWGVVVDGDGLPGPLGPRDLDDEPPTARRAATVAPTMTRRAFALSRLIGLDLTYES